MLRYVKTRLNAGNGSRKAASGASPYRRRDEPRLLALLRSTALFDPQWYLLVNSDVAGAGIDPYVHYIRHGAAEGRATSIFFDSNYYFSQFPGDERPAVALLHYLESDWSAQKDPLPYFDQRWYVARTGISPADAPTPADHYLRQGPPYLHDPSPVFSNAQYLRNNPDVAESGVNPLVHYIRSGKSEGREINGPVRYRVRAAREGRASLAGQDVVVLALYCPRGELSALQREIIATYRNDGFFVVAVVNSGDLNRASDAHRSQEPDILITRENLGFRFGAWVEAIGVVGGLSTQCRSVSFTSDGLAPRAGRGGVGVRETVRRHSHGVVFMTRSDDVLPHERPDFFTVNEDCLRRGALGVMTRFGRFEIAQDAFRAGDLMLGHTFRKEGFETHVVFDEGGAAQPAPCARRGVRDLFDPLDEDTIARAGPPPSQTDDRSGHRLDDAVKAHLEARAIPCEPRLEPACTRPLRAIEGTALMGPIGELQAYNYPPGQNPAILVPFPEDRRSNGATPPAALAGFGKVLVVVHCFYLDIAETILRKVDRLGLAGQVVCTTDTAAKKDRLDAILAGTALRADVLVVPNRGRDVAPFLIEGRRYLPGHDYVLHLHTKKSPHSSVYAGWGDFLFENLIGSPAVARSILRLLAEGPFGIVYSRHFHVIGGLRNWGFDYDKARDLLAKMGVELSVDRILEFPTSTMFWARAEAIRPLFDLPLDYESFDVEAGQIDGTLAHAIERSLLYVCEHQGFDHTMVAVRRYRDSDQLVTIGRPEDVASLEIPKPRLLQSLAMTSQFHRDIEDVYPVQILRSLDPRKRLNILTPTLEPAQIYGGISSAIRVGGRLYEALGAGVDLRIVVTSDHVSHRSLDEAAKRFRRDILKVWPNADPDAATVVPLAELKECPLSLRADDVFFATAWWTADLAYRLKRAQEEVFGVGNKVVYLIQDYETGFYGWSSRSVLAKDTYRNGDDTITIFNSEELANFMTERFDFPDCWHLPYEIDASIAAARKPVAKENLVLVYGRRHATRNLFSIIVEGLRLWQYADPHVRSATQIVFAGEDFDEKLVGDLANARVAGKLSLDDYAGILSRAAVGVSLMESPHPSYPPLEMASSGCITVANNYCSKDMSLRSDNIIALDEVSPRTVSEAVSQALARAPIGRTCAFDQIRPIPTSVPVFDAQAVADRICNAVPRGAAEKDPGPAPAPEASVSSPAQ